MMAIDTANQGTLGLGTHLVTRANHRTIKVLVDRNHTPKETGMMAKHGQNQAVRNVSGSMVLRDGQDNLQALISRPRARVRS